MPRGQLSVINSLVAARGIGTPAPHNRVIE